MSYSSIGTTIETGELKFAVPSTESCLRPLVKLIFKLVEYE